eukprot:CAMPEP_0197441460 /NCGR_PEP_ID=MMETSP1175-20131217/7729_1 /TAXON_ID=1003142 /ORGANISM="Triceratium dubium, Strain CCMP147" /LENGTH=135 /DNA_ID=CAMNT_0042971737 /DNA_START=623 /DNA_END=1030 /DNA_ORIENTATION=+
MTRILTQRIPTQTGKILREEFIGPMGLTQKELVEQIYLCPLSAGQRNRQFLPWTDTEHSTAPCEVLRRVPGLMDELTAPLGAEELRTRGDSSLSSEEDSMNPEERRVLESAAESFRQGWQEAFQDETYYASSKPP